MKIKLCEHGDVFVSDDSDNIIWSPYLEKEDALYMFGRQQGITLEGDFINFTDTLKTWGEQIDVAAKASRDKK